MFNFTGKSWIHFSEGTSSQSKEIERKSVKKHHSRKAPLETLPSETSSKTTKQDKDTDEQKNNSFFRWAIKHSKLICFIAFFAVFLLFLLLIILFNIDMFNYVLFVLFRGGGLTLIFSASKLVCSLFKPDKRDFIRRENEDILQSTIYALKYIWECIKGSRLACMAFVFTVIFTLASVSTHVAYEGFPGLRSFFENRIQHDSNPVEKASDDQISDNNDEEQPNPSNTQPEPEIKSGFLIDPERYYKLTDEEESKLFFLDGSYKIMNRTDTDAIVNQLYPFVKELLAPQTENLFDKDAPDDVKDDISDVSNLEKIMSNSNDLDKIIEKRIEVWGSNYKKYGIAFLLANNMQHYANEYTIIDGAYETIKYYHAQSIFWTWDSLAFNYVTPHMLKDGLNYISARYHDIADQAAKGSEEEIHALALYEAFRILKNMDFTLSDKQQIE